MRVVYSGAGGHSRGVWGRSLRLRPPGERAGESPAVCSGLYHRAKMGLPSAGEWVVWEDSGDFSSTPVLPPARPAGTPDAHFLAPREKGVPCPALFLLLPPRTPFWRSQPELCPQGRRCSQGTALSAASAGHPGTAEAAA